jgi:hypothetical protein
LVDVDESPGGVDFVPLATVGAREAIWRAAADVLSLRMAATRRGSSDSSPDDGRCCCSTNLEQIEGAAKVLHALVSAAPVDDAVN